jgi:hypothetical protein
MRTALNTRFALGGKAQLDWPSFSLRYYHERIYWMCRG